MKKNFLIVTGIFAFTALITSGCGTNAKSGSVATGIPTTSGTGTSEGAAVSVPTISTSVVLVTATTAQCASGGSVMELFKDANGNGTLDSGETVISTTPICNGTQGASGTNGTNGTNGSNGTNGISAGLQVVAATAGSCPAGGSVLNTFQDLNSNGIRDTGEAITSTSTVCNGVNGTNGTNGTNGSNGTNGTNGKNAYITAVAATTAQCPTGGVVYSSYTEGQAAQVTVVCNGLAGTNGTNGTNAVGPAIPGKAYTACHHDVLYSPDATGGARGWLIFRHQNNGASDQGIGSTGFNVWDVDMSDFQLASEVGGVIYCTLHWDPVQKLLNYTINDNTDGLGGTSGFIKF